MATPETSEVTGTLVEVPEAGAIAIRAIGGSRTIAMSQPGEVFVQGNLGPEGPMHHLVIKRSPTQPDGEPVLIPYTLRAADGGNVLDTIVTGYSEEFGFSENTAPLGRLLGTNLTALAIRSMQEGRARAATRQKP